MEYKESKYVTVHLMQNLQPNSNQIGTHRFQQQYT